MNNFCAKCGKELTQDQNACPNCGTFIRNEVNDLDKKATTGLVLGLVGIIAWLLPLAGYPVTICGIVFSAKGMKSQNGKGKATAGLVLSIIFLVFTFINSAIGALSTIYYMY